MAATWMVYRTRNGKRELAATLWAGKPDEPRVEPAESAAGTIFTIDFRLWLATYDFDVYDAPLPADPAPMDWSKPNHVQQAMWNFQRDSDGRYAVEVDGLELPDVDESEKMEEGAIP